LKVTRLPLELRADPTRVLARPYVPGSIERVCGVVARLAAMSDAQAERTLHGIVTAFESRHRNINEIFEAHYNHVAPHLDGMAPTSPLRQRLVGACLTLEYSLESVALFNPSIVLHTDQSGLPTGATRFIMSLRACGEGHISSIEFRSGVINADGSVTLDAASRTASYGRHVEERLYARTVFFQKLSEMEDGNALGAPLAESMPDEFTMDQLEGAIEALRPTQRIGNRFDEQAEGVLWLARSNYHLTFPSDSDLSERVIFPVTENESRGIEDARFVRFVEPDGRAIYYATYTAYNGVRILPQLIRTEDFLRFEIHTLNGPCVRNKGMALFPRRIGGDYWMVSRIDGENLFLAKSDNVYYWNNALPLRRPTLTWEIIQIGNCGSPLETDAGWLLLTHGVGPMRQYWIGALLLDLEDPTKVIGALDEPLMVPQADEQDGYVPNVVYSCGAIIRQDLLVIPYGAADSYTRIATVPLADVLARLTS